MYLDSWRRVKERCVEFETISGDLVRQGGEEHSVVHIHADEQDA